MTSLYGPNLLAQQSENQTQPDTEETKELDAVVVTGSRIARIGMISPSPITTITAEQVRASGATTLGDLLNQLPQLAPTFNLSNSSRFIGTVGVGQLDLRGLGTSRTLVLVNGRRHVGATSGSTAVDTNTIPVEWIERVEVITGGASAVYGADAVAGVVNFILRKDFNGWEARVQYGEPAEGDFSQTFGSVSGGFQFAEDRGNVGMSFEYSEQGRYARTDREIGRQYLINFLNPAFDPSRPASQDNPIRTPQGPGGIASLSNGGRFLVGGVPYIFLADGTFRRQNLGSVDGGNCINCDFLDLNAVADLQPSLERFSFNSVLNYNFNEDHQMTVEFKYANNKSDFLGQPTFDQPIRIRRDNAYITPELAAVLNAGGITAPSSTFSVNRFNVDAGQRGELVERKTTRGVVAFEGTIFDNWTYDASLVYGETVVDRLNTNNRINERFQAGLDAVRDAQGRIVCRVSLDPAAINPTTGRAYSSFAATGCVPFSVFGEGAINAEARNWFNVASPNRTKLTQYVASASVANSALFDLPAGGVGFAGGLEYRRETSREDTDPLSAAGLTFLNAIPSRQGAYDVQEAFVEFSAPLLADLPGAESVIFDIAGRASDYSTIGSTQTWRLGLDWTIVDDVRFRATRGQAVRAPNIAELFNPQSQNFAAIADPCDSRPGTGIAIAADPAVRRANCAALGIPTNFIDQTPATTPGLTGGNPNLLEESAVSESIGLVWTPSFVDGLGISVDYWEVDLTDAIGSVAAQTLANRCVDAPGGINNVFCSAITRAGATPFTDSQGRLFPAYEITFFRATAENLARSLRSGVDFEVNYAYELFGTNITTSLVTSYYKRSRDFAFQDFPNEFTESVGVITQPRWRGTLNNTFRYGDWRLGFETRYVDKVLRVSRESFRTAPGQFAPISFGSHVVHDMNVRYTFGETGLEVSGGIDNLFDKDPPLNAFGAGASDSIYDTIGRYYFVGATYRF
jgi:outer membrane receptor protein involved in Fe transport